MHYGKLIAVELISVCSPDYLKQLPVSKIEDLFKRVCFVQ
jgi:hypothetical protein